MFPARVRLSGMAVGTQVGFAIGGFAPTIAGALAGPGAAGWLPVAALTAALTAGFCVVSALAASTARETYRVPTEALGAQRPPRLGDRGAVPAS